LDRHLLDRGLRQLCLLREDLLRQDLLSALCAFIAVEELGLVGVDPDDGPGLTPGFLKRIADLAYDRLSGRDRESMQRAPLTHADSRRVATR